MRPVRLAVKAIIIVDGKILVTRNSHKNGDYFLLPGGGQENGETIHDALRREVREEVGCETVIGELRFVRDYIGKNHEFRDEDPEFHQVELMFECQLMASTDDAVASLPDPSQIGVDWLPVDELEEMLFYPRALAPLLRKALPATATYLGDIT